MSANQTSILHLQVPFGALPRFFVPPISGKQIQPALPNDFTVEIDAANVRRRVFIQQDGCRQRRPKSAQSNVRRFQDRSPHPTLCLGERRACASTAVREFLGVEIPRKRLHATGVRISLSSRLDCPFARSHIRTASRLSRAPTCSLSRAAS